MKLKILLFGIILAFNLLADGYYYERETELSGKLITELHYGAPGFGENPDEDRKVYPFILVLDKAIEVKEDKEYQRESGVSKIQLALPYSDIEKAKKLKNGIVKVKGSLFHSDNGNHYTAVLMEVKKIESKRGGK